MITQNFSDWMRQPGGSALDTHAFALEQKQANIAAERRRRYQNLLTEFYQARADGMTHKIWDTVGGNSARHAHRAADGQRRRLDETFSVGGERLFLPNDLEGSFAQTANCRCQVRYVRLENGREVPYAPAPRRTHPRSQQSRLDAFFERLRNIQGFPLNTIQKAFLTHYFLGGGQALDLESVGLLDTVRNAPVMKAASIKFQKKCLSE